MKTRVWTAAALALGAGLVASCTARWAVQTVQAPFALQWPYPPNRAKLTYLRSISGFTKSGSAGDALASVVAGVERRGADALALPVAVATASDGRLAVADMGRSCVHLYVPATRRYLRLTRANGESMRSPVAVAFDDALTLWVSDSAGRLFRFGPDGAPLLVLRSAGKEPLQRPTGLAYSPKTRLVYVVDTLAGRVHALRSGGELAFTFGGRGEGDGQLNFPTHIAWSPQGQLLVTDSMNFRIQTFGEDGKFVRAFGHHGDGSGDFAMPKGVAGDRDGVVYVADHLFDVVQLFDREGRFLLTLGRRGAEPGEFWMPSGVFVNGGGELYVCDTYNHRIQVFRITEGYEPQK